MLTHHWDWGTCRNVRELAQDIRAVPGQRAKTTEEVETQYIPGLKTTPISKLIPQSTCCTGGGGGGGAAAGAGASAREAHAGTGRRRRVGRRSRGRRQGRLRRTPRQGASMRERERERESVSKWSCLSTAGGTPPLGYLARRVVTPASPGRPPREGGAGHSSCVSTAWTSVPTS
jgi:hypothetical protein